MNSFDSNGHSNKVYSPTTEEELQEMLESLGIQHLEEHQNLPPHGAVAVYHFGLWLGSFQGRL